MLNATQAVASLRGASLGQCSATSAPMDRSSFVSAGQRMGAAQERLRLANNRLSAVTERIVGGYPCDPTPDKCDVDPSNVVSALHMEIDAVDRQTTSIMSAVVALEQATGA